MPLPKSEIERKHIHSRSISFNGYQREDGLFDIEGHIQDTRPYDLDVPCGSLLAGKPIHEMWLRLTVDAEANIVGVCASTDAAPYGRSCAVITSDYERLVGLRIGPGFRSKVHTLLGGVQGCTHLTELLLAMGTATIQALVGHVPEPDGVKPFSLDGCHALDTRGYVVAQFHPQWYRPTEATTTALMRVIRTHRTDGKP